jgi:hypothetical protein
MKQANDRIFHIRNSDGVQRLEDGLLLYDNGRGEVPHQVDRLLDFVSTSLFGIRRAEVYISPENFESAIDEWEYEQDFETSKMDSEDAASFLETFGLDFYDANGSPLRCTRFLKLQAEAAAKGYCGHLPDPTVAATEKLQSTLEAEAAAFLVRKHRRA